MGTRASASDDHRRDRVPGRVLRRPLRAGRLRLAPLPDGVPVLPAQVQAPDAERHAARSCRGSPSSCRSSTRCTWWSGSSRRSAASTTRASCSRSRCWTTRPTRPAPSPAPRWSATAAPGIDITYIHRTNRQGFKAGALENGLQLAPRASSSRSSTPTSCPRRTSSSARCRSSPTPKVGMVQVRWGHLNREFSILTQAQSIFLDGHFIIEHTARNRSRLLLQLQRHRRHLAAEHHRATPAAGSTTRSPRTSTSPTARSCKGWQFIFLPEVVSPGRGAGGHERLQEPAAPLGQGLHPDRAEAPAHHPPQRTCRSR